MYLNLAESRRDPASFWTEQAYHRLRRIETTIDPDNLIRSNHPIPPASPVPPHRRRRSHTAKGGEPVTRGLPDIEGRNLAVEDEGSGPAVLMLHGLGGTTSVFQVQAEVLSSAFRVLRMDFRGAGRSPLAEGVSIAGHVDDALAVMSTL